MQQRTNEPAERSVAAPFEPKSHITVDVMFAIKTAIPTLVFSAISDAVTTQPEINKIKNKKQTSTEASMKAIDVINDFIRYFDT